MKSLQSTGVWSHERPHCLPLQPGARQSPCFHTSNLHPDSIRNAYNPKLRRQPNFSKGKRCEPTCPKRSHQEHETMLTSTGPQCHTTPHMPSYGDVPTRSGRLWSPGAPPHTARGCAGYLHLIHFREIPTLNLVTLKYSPQRHKNTSS